jgi:hypothetical protein
MNENGVACSTYGERRLQDSGGEIDGKGTIDALVEYLIYNSFFYVT